MATRDYAFEALAEVTGTDWNTGRGELNAALRSIREETGVEDSYVLADLIHQHAKHYREVMPGVLITPTALAKHWKRVGEEATRPSRTPGRANQHAAPTGCRTCHGDRFVHVLTRPAKTSTWMRERGIEADGQLEEYAPCPDCGPSVPYTPDPARVREMMRS